jgi:hypothetical protein
MSKSIDWDWNGTYVGSQSVGDEWTFEHKVEVVDYPHVAKMTIKVDDIDGQLIRLIVDGETTVVAVGSVVSLAHILYLDRGHYTFDYNRSIDARILRIRDE